MERKLFDLFIHIVEHTLNQIKAVFALEHLDRKVRLACTCTYYKSAFEM